MNNTPSAFPDEPVRRLSPWRVMLGIMIFALFSASSVFGFQQWRTTRLLTSREPWFAPYVDVTSSPTFPFDELGATDHKDAVLSFVTSLPAEPCTPAWGGAYTMDKANAALDLDRRVARLREQRGDVAISFGGLKNTELAVDCTDNAQLQAAYQAVIDRYKADTIDLDLEKSGLVNQDVNIRRAGAIAKLQAARRAQGKSLAVWVTLPVTPQGLDDKATNAVATLLAGKVDIAGVNIMTMDYGTSLGSGQSMVTASESAATQTVRQLQALYQRAGIQLNSASLWAKLGMTPMIGQNDDSNEVFSPDNAKALNAFARSHHVVRMSMWSANRDMSCGGNYVDVKIVSDSCSGVIQDKQQYASLLSSSFKGSFSLSSSLVTTADQPGNKQEADDPKTSPYPIWSASSSYLQGTKVVWHHNVYQAKWYTSGDMPDNPVLQTWQTSWDLIGPVLPGEKPIPQPTLPAGTYPDWDGTKPYNTGERILFNSVPYQAKWWNQGNSPAAVSSNPDGSPWTPLTQTQINEIEAGYQSAAARI